MHSRQLYTINTEPNMRVSKHKLLAENACMIFCWKVKVLNYLNIFSNII